MKVFSFHQIREALAYAAAGGQAMHLHRILNRRTAPGCFIAAVDRGEHIAHLFDLDADRLTATLRRLGVRKVRVELAGTYKQHADLCGAPLHKAMLSAENHRTTTEGTEDANQGTSHP